MRVIVNESQYNKILIKENADHKNAQEWASYLSGTLLVNILKLDIGEDVFTHKNLNNKLKTYKFFKNLPIESIIVSIIKNKNLYEDVKIDINYNPYWTTIVEDKRGKKYIKDVEFEVVTYLPNDLTQSNIKKLQSQILEKLTDEFIKIYHWFEKNKEIIPPYSLSPEPLQEIKLYTTEPDLNLGSLGDEIDVLNLIVHDITSKPIHILNVKEDEVMIDMSSFTTDQINNIEKKIKGYFPDTKVKLNSGEKTLSFIHVDDIEAEKELFKNWYEDDEEIEYTQDEDTEEIVVSADEEFIVPIPNSNEVYKNNHYFLKDPPNEKVEVKYVYDFLRRKGLSSEQAAGILGNIYHESVFNTGIIGDGGSSMGLCQWHKSRLKKLSSFAKIKDKNITDKDLQLDFLWNELMGRYKSVLNKIKKSTTVKDASFIWASQYEGCEGCKNKDSGTNKIRSKKGEEYYEQYKGSNIKKKEKDKKVTPDGSKLSKIQFDRIPGTTDYRSGQPTLDQLAYIMKNYGIKNVIRLNAGSGHGAASNTDGKIVTTAAEREVVEKYGGKLYPVEGGKYPFVDAHNPRYGDGDKGYTGTIAEVLPILDKGHTLIHCTHGADRTGYVVASYLKDRKNWDDEQKLWDYTLKYNGWCGRGDFIGSGFDTYATSFIEGKMTQSKFDELCKNRTDTKKIKTDYSPPTTLNIHQHPTNLKILFIGDSQTAGRTSYAHLLKEKSKGTTTIDAVASRNTEQMLSALKKVNNIGQYNVIVIMGGGNDSWRDNEEYSIKNFTAMYNYVKNANPDAILIAITNPTKKHLPDYNIKWPSNDMIAQWVKNNTLTTHVINANKLGKDYFKVDDFHLNQQGQDWIYGKLQNILKKNKFNI